MQKYKDYRPTQFDRKGAFLEDNKQVWLVVPVIQTRESRILEQCNFEVALEMLGGESDAVQVHRFGHWGPGWFEIIIVEPNSEQASIAESIEAMLEGYPILDEMKFSEMSWIAINDYWESASISDRLDMLKRYKDRTPHDETSIFVVRQGLSQDTTFTRWAEEHLESELCY